MNASIKTITPLRVASLRHTGPYAECGPTWEKLLEALGAEGHLGPGTRLFGIGYDDPEVTPPEQVRYDASVTVDDNYQSTGDITVQEIRGGDYAVITHQGPYTNLATTYQELIGRWIPRSGRELADAPCFEEYLNDPYSTEPDELLTDIYAPLA
jgi:AraC family transcriptional regulator